MDKYYFRVKYGQLHCVKSVQIQSFSDLYFSTFGLNTGKYGPEKTPYLDTFHAVLTFRCFTETFCLKKVRCLSQKSSCDRCLI